MDKTDHCVYVRISVLSYLLYSSDNFIVDQLRNHQIPLDRVFIQRQGISCGRGHPLIATLQTASRDDDGDDDGDGDDGDDDDDDVHGHYNDGLVQGRGYPSIATL